MNILLVGYGRMGRELESIIDERGHRVLYRVDSAGTGDSDDLNDAPFDQADGVIEFALADGIVDRIRRYAAENIPCVIGTTGWDDWLSEAKKVFQGSESALLRGSNFSLGAHLFFRLSAAAARLLNRVEEYDVSVTEYHHRKKADYPSGTAITAAEGILKELERKSRWIKDLPDAPIPPDALQIASVRVGSAAGVHETRMDSPADFLILRHEARGRAGFALGAVRALEWLSGKQGWYETDAFIDDLLDGK